MPCLEEICATCKWYVPDGIAHAAYCHRLMSEPDPAFTCTGWLDYRTRIDAQTGEVIEGAVDKAPRPQPIAPGEEEE